jgi:deazaflavin-dependent oxidoreductase (nitroreductase family)
MTQPNRFFLRVMWKLHRFWYRVSIGRIGAKVSGLPVLELTTTGRKTGQARSVLLTYLKDPRGFIVIASNAGSTDDPAWWRNLQSHPRASVRRGRTVREVRMRPLDGGDRADAWDRAVAAFPGYATYATTAGRTIPVVLLEVERGAAN